MSIAARERTAPPPRPPAWRVVAAFVVAPGAAALVMAAATPLYAGLDPGERLWRSAATFAAFGAYPAALVLGVPACFLLRGRLAPSLVNCASAGAVIAALPWFALSLLSGPDQASIDGRATVIDGSRTAYGWLTQATFLGGIALFGALGGAVFWLVAAAGRPAGWGRSRR